MVLPPQGPTNAQQLGCRICLPSLLGTYLPSKEVWKTTSVIEWIFENSINIAQWIGIESHLYEQVKYASTTGQRDQAMQLIKQLNAIQPDRYTEIRKAIDFLIRQGSSIYELTIQEVFDHTKQFWEPCLQWLFESGYLADESLKNLNLNDLSAIDQFVCGHRTGLEFFPDLPALDATKVREAVKKCPGLGDQFIANWRQLNQNPLKANLVYLYHHLEMSRIALSKQNELAKIILPPLSTKCGKKKSTTPKKYTDQELRTFRNTSDVMRRLEFRIVYLQQQLSETLVSGRRLTLASSDSLLKALRAFIDAAQSSLLHEQKAWSCAKASIKKTMPDNGPILMKSVCEFAMNLSKSLDTVFSDLRKKEEISIDELEIINLDRTVQKCRKNKRIPCKGAEESAFEIDNEPSDEEPELEESRIQLDNTVPKDIVVSSSEIEMKSIPPFETLIDQTDYVGIWSSHLWNLDNLIQEKYNSRINNLEIQLKPETKRHVKELTSKLRLCVIDLECLAEARKKNNLVAIYLAVRCLYLDLGLAIEQLLSIELAIQKGIQADTHHLKILSKELSGIETIQTMCNDYSLSLYWVRYMQHSIEKQQPSQKLQDLHSLWQKVNNGSSEEPLPIASQTAQDAVLFLKFALGESGPISLDDLDKLSLLFVCLEEKNYDVNLPYKITNQKLFSLASQMEELICKESNMNVKIWLTEAQHLIHVLDISLIAYNADKRLKTKFWNTRNILVVDKIAEALYQAVCHRRGMGHVDSHNIRHFYHILSCTDHDNAKNLTEFNLGVHHHYETFGKRKTNTCEIFDSLQSQLKDNLLDFKATAEVKDVPIDRGITALQTLAKWAVKELTGQ